MAFDDRNDREPLHRVKVGSKNSNCCCRRTSTSSGWS
jgi:hypothetical protein